MFFHIVLLLTGILACSFAVILIKISAVPAFLLAAYRLVLAALILTPWFVRDLRRHRAAYSARSLGAAVLPGIFLGLHFITWNIGARMTPAANATLFINLSPAATPLLLYFIAHETITRREMAGTAIALLGALLLSFHDFSVSAQSFRGDMMCVASALLYALYFALGRRNRRQPTLLLYVVPLYCVAGVFSFLAALGAANPVTSVTWRDGACILGLALIPTVIGHSLINNSLRFVRGQIVSVVSQSQIVMGALLAFLLLDEVPPLALYPAALLVVVGAALALAPDKDPARHESIGEAAGE
jgi:drug/metabolite transporter (DMT)-like permease